MADDYIRVGFVEGVQEVRQEGTFVGHWMNDTLFVRFGEVLEVGREALERANIGVDRAGEGLGRRRVIDVD